MLSNLLNPNVMVFMLAFLPQFVDADRGAIAGHLLVLGGLQKITDLVVLGGTSLAAGELGDWLSRRPGWLIWQERLLTGALRALR